MKGNEMAEEMTIEAIMKQEEQVWERKDEIGDTWRKLYFGGGGHFENWLEQCKEVYSEDDLEIEEVDPTGFKCFEEGGERMYRIWVRAERRRNGN